MKHKHAELIHAWADGAKIEARYQKASGWTEWAEETGGFYWYQGGAEYRIKPEPKPDITTERTLFWNKAIGVLLHDGLAREWLKDGKYYEVLGDFKITFDGETGKIKSAEVIE